MLDRVELICKKTLENSPFRDGRVISNKEIVGFAKEIKRLVKHAKQKERE